MLGPAQSWPAVQAGRADAVRITFTAGYGAEAASVPAPLRAAVLLMVGSMLFRFLIRFKRHIRFNCLISVSEHQRSQNAGVS